MADRPHSVDTGSLIALLGMNKVIELNIELK